MADMIDAKEAKQILGCDDDTLQKHVNAGTIRAQRVGGKLMLNREDVDKIKEEDGTIVLTGDSDNLSIYLGKVVDDTSETMVQTGPKDTQAGESITFGEELEVVNFDDTNTRDLSMDEKRGDKTGSLSFTDSNTAVMTAVDETQIGATTAPVDFQTSTDQPASSQSGRGPADSRRSVRSNRARAEVQKVHVGWIILMVLILAIGTFLIIPYYFFSTWPSAEVPISDASVWNKTETRRGVTDNTWTNIASMVAQFSVEPNEKHFKEMHGSDAQFTSYSDTDRQATWRYEEYLGTLKGKDERLNSFLITEVSEDGKTAYTADHKQSYPIVTKTVNGVETTYVDLPANAK